MGSHHQLWSSSKPARPDEMTQIAEQALVAHLGAITARAGSRSSRKPPPRIDGLLGSIIDHLPAVLSVKDSLTRKYILVNRAFERLVDGPADQIIGQTICDLFPIDGARYDHRDSAVLTSRSPLIVESAGRRADGSIVQLRTKRIPIRGPDLAAQYILGLTEDITDLRLAEAAARLDRLTGLVNRTEFIDRLDRLVVANVPFALLKIELHRFKSVNDHLGVELADRMLAQAADRLRAIAMPADIVGRIAGNEFGMILLGNRPQLRSHPTAAAISKAFAEPFIVMGRPIQREACVGIAQSSGNAGFIEDVRRHADIALRRAKSLGGAGICTFSPEMDAALKERSRLENDLRNALRSGEITVAYQPISAVAAGRVSSVEALARWTHPVRGPIGPDVFIPLAEELGLVCALGEHVLRQACTDALEWPDDLRVSVNLSPLQFERGNLHATISSVLEDTGLAANRLQLEVTESLLIRDVERTFQQLEQLRALGIQILMDDFGVGYSSLSYLQKFAFDAVKIDRSFINGIGKADSAMAIIPLIVGLGQKLGMGIVAEGVETDAQAAYLRAAGCTHLQGFLFSRPLDASALGAFMSRPPREDPGIDHSRA